MSYHQIITVEPGKRGGQPCVRGMRITVYDVLSYLASGMSEEEILSDFPELTREDILACLSFAADRSRRRHEIEITAGPESVAEWSADFVEVLGSLSDEIERSKSQPISKKKDPFA
jgi:uncharacterized protein (DUF433 family)